MSTAYRYPGAQPFTPNDRRIFYGREEDTRRLVEKIRLEQMVVLYAKSGLGKSSLLNAAVVPRLQESREGGRAGVFAVPLRFGSYTEAGDAHTPLQNVLERLRALGRAGDWTGRFGEAVPLWQALKSVQGLHPDQPLLLILDQFEELFTYPPAQIKAFAAQLAQALYERIPKPVRAVLERQAVTLDAAEQEALFQPLNLKVVFAIRSDRMSFLDELKDHLPDILHKTYQLKPLTRLQAEDAILNPAYHNDSDFAVQRFDYTDEALDFILNFLSGGGQATIETTQLQIICQHAEHLVEDGAVRQRNQAGIPQVRPDDLGDLSRIYRRYYDAMLDEIPTDEERLTVRKLIEEDLIFEPDKRRISLYEGIIHGKGISDEILSLLVNKHHLLRAEPNMSGGYTYELSHDTLVEPILEAKHARQAEERRREQEALHRQAEAERREAERRAEEALAKAKEEAALRVKAVQGRRLAYILAGIALIALVFVGFYYNSAKRATQEAEENYQMAREHLQASLGAQIGEIKTSIGVLVQDTIIYRQAEEGGLVKDAADSIMALKIEEKNLKIKGLEQDVIIYEQARNDSLVEVKKKEIERLRSIKDSLNSVLKEASGQSTEQLTASQ